MCVIQSLENGIDAPCTIQRHRSMRKEYGFCVQVMGHIVRMSVRMRMNAGATRARGEGWHVRVRSVFQREVTCLVRWQLRGIYMKHSELVSQGRFTSLSTRL